ncbi:DNA repair protein RecN [Nitrincola alkalilacustris]|uniref:DNA repair protein RecN n=1 Tax=Nitrincola alkalilacustris TaxID=1571224 RepID=UPI00124E027A|nr:DNA repair protein RecN [Nitrincola alkalilacustris]
MLTHLIIRNFAIVDELDIDLSSGMTVISGETGAGKSIMLDALALTLGDRADSDTVRSGAERAEITAIFDLQQIPDAREWLQAQDLDQDEEECQLRRIVTREGRSRSYINGQPVPLAHLRELGQFLVDIHGQHEHQRLLKKEYHRTLLDQYARQTELSDQVRKAYHTWQRQQNELTTKREQNAEQDARLQLLNYQIEELDQLAIQDGELAQLEEEQRMLDNAGSLLSTGHQLLEIASEGENENCISLLSHCQQLLVSLNSRAPALLQAGEMLNNAQIQLEEASREIRHYLDQVEVNPQRQQEVEERLTLIYDVARKHRVQPEQLLELHRSLQAELDEIQRSDEILEELELAVTAAHEEYAAKAAQLSLQRSKAAATLNKAVDQQLHSLGMMAASFTVSLQPLDAGKGSANGMEEVEFLISTNKGLQARPLAKVASGGELSRISLAIQVITAQTSATPTLIFDEVDVGIGGAIAEVVGRMLRDLGQRTQVLCVTHQPQVAAQGDQHLFVSKEAKGQLTQTRIDLLNEEKRIQEVARMLGGIELTEATLLHAQEMLSPS